MGRAARSKHKESEQAGVERYGFYLVAYVDLLGQTDELMQLTKLDHSEAAWPEARKILKRTAGRVQMIRRRHNPRGVGVSAEYSDRRLGSPSTHAVSNGHIAIEAHRRDRASTETGSTFR